ncbi:uncharacterized protein LOC125227484 [Leguminivora glycinivorella]|uniref:uncharacterized protein LOC125227484 n=1 Tax=Leguminivora glycinivorella TaxID=1035111 RepID=UPI00200F7E37|nr:uncharacterized protein LOC125227484 [Leguminivora glycinivorella]
MGIILVISTGFLLSLAVANPSRPCGCRPVFVFCANDHHTYHSICEYKCRHPSTPFQDWYILYQEPCLEMSDLSESETTTKPNSHHIPKCSKVQGYKWEPRTGSCYKYHMIVWDWQKAKAICQDEGVTWLSSTATLNLQYSMNFTGRANMKCLTPLTRGLIVSTLILVLRNRAMASG